MLEGCYDIQFARDGVPYFFVKDAREMVLVLQDNGLSFKITPIWMLEDSNRSRRTIRNQWEKGHGRRTRPTPESNSAGAALDIIARGQRIGRLAYRLDLPSSRTQKGIHPVISIGHLEPAPSEDDPWKDRPNKNTARPLMKDSHMTQTATMSNA